MYHAIPTRKEVLRRATVHLDKLKLGKMFPSYEAGWTGKEAADLLGLIDDLCLILDHVAPKLLDRAWSARARELDVNYTPGSILRASRERIAVDGGFSDMMEANCQLLKQAAAGQGTCAWNMKGCSALHNILEELIYKVTKLTPTILSNVAKASETEMPRFLEAVS